MEEWLSGSFAHLDLCFSDIEGQVADNDLTSLVTTWSSTRDDKGLVPVSSNYSSSIGSFTTNGCCLGTAANFAGARRTPTCLATTALGLRLNDVIES